MKTLLAAKKASERAVLAFRTDCRNMMAKLVPKLNIKSPLDYSVLRNMCCLDPAEICSDHEKCNEKFRRIVVEMESLGQVNAKDCDDILNEFQTFSSVAHRISNFREFDKTENRIESLYYKHMNKPEYEHVWKVVLKLLLLSHGQSEIKLLLSDADIAADLAEKKKNVPQITKSNTLRRRAKDKEEELTVVKKEFEEKQLKWRNT